MNGNVVINQNQSNVKLIGLTGLIASGKSTVGKMLRSCYDVLYIDADVLARNVVEPDSDGLKEVIAKFGLEFLLPDGNMDRKKMGALVFSNPDAKKDLEDILHPRILTKFKEILNNIKSSSIKYVVFENAILLQNIELAKMMDQIILVTATVEKQIERLKKRNNLTEDEAKLRINSQPKLLELQTIAINNSIPFLALESNSDVDEKLSELWADITEFFGNKSYRNFARPCYFVTAIAYYTEDGSDESANSKIKRHSSRVFGYYKDLKLATEVVLSSGRGIEEFLYNWLVVEEICPNGIHPRSLSEKWFKFNLDKEQFEEYNSTPDFAHNITNWSIG